MTKFVSSPDRDPTNKNQVLSYDQKFEAFLTYKNIVLGAMSDW